MKLYVHTLSLCIVAFPIFILAGEVFAENSGRKPQPFASRDVSLLPFRLRSIEDPYSVGQSRSGEGKLLRMPKRVLPDVMKQDSLMIHNERHKRNVSQKRKPGLQISPAPLQHVLDSQVQHITTEWIQHSSQHPFPSTDVLNALAVDGHGNVYVTGRSDETITGADYLTIKYTPLGDSVWTRRFDGVGSGYDEATALCVDQEGNVYVTGYSFDPYSEYNYITVKYDSNGVQQWVATYDGHDSTDIAISIALDLSGDVVITGFSYSTTGNFDYATVKYSTDGIEKWSRRYDGSDHLFDEATALAIDASGNIIVTGFSFHTETGEDCHTIMYDSFGNEQWSATYDGVSHTTDIPTALALDSIGNIYMAGYTYQNSVGYNYLTIKYSHTGTQQWSAGYNGPGNYDDIATALGVDRTGNIYVTGFSVGAVTIEDYCTIRYDQNGQEQWNVRYSGANNGSDVPVGMAIDSSQNVYVTGFSYFNEHFSRDMVTVKYDTTGRMVWIQRYHSESDHDDLPAVVALDPSGDVYVGGNSVGSDGSEDYAIVKYTQTEFGPWPVRYNYGVYHCNASAMVIDRKANILVSGTDGSHFLTIKLDSAGNIRWSEKFGPAKSAVTAIATDDSTNVYVAGYTLGLGGTLDYATVKYSPDGVQRWEAQYAGAGNGHDKIVGLVVDREQSVYVTGTSFGGASSNDYLTIKYNALGQQVWTARYNGLYNGYDAASGIALDSSGNVYVTGTSVSSGSTYDFVTIKYSPDGVQQWEELYDGTGNGADFAKDLKLDRHGNIYVTGRSFGRFSTSDFATIKYAPDGGVVWVSRYDGPSSGVDDPVRLAVDDSDNVYVLGSSYSSQTSSDFALVKYDRSGTQQWVTRYGGSSRENDFAVAISIDDKQQVYIAGTVFDSSSRADYATIKYSPDGVQEWIELYNGFANADDRVAAMTIDPRGYVYVAGSSYGLSYTEDYLVTRTTLEKGSVDQWPAQYEGPGVLKDGATDLSLDNTGDIYIGGTTGDAQSLLDFSVSKYSSAGELLWNTTYNDPTGEDDRLRALAVDHNNNLFVGGILFGTFTPIDYGVLKYNPDGTQNWITIYNDYGNDFNFLSGCTLDNNGDLYVTGSSGGHVPYHFTTIKYSNNGAQQWVAHYATSPIGDALAYAIAVDRYGNTYVTGQSSGLGTGQDFTTVKYDANGEEQWVALYDGPLHNDDRAVAIAVDTNSNVVVTGWSRGVDATYDYETIMYDTRGSELWRVRYVGKNKTNDLPAAICLDSAGNVFITGASYKSYLENGDYTTVKYSSSGQEQWHVTYNGPGDNDDVPASISVDHTGNAYVTGSSIGQDGTYDYATIKYDMNGQEQWIERYSYTQNSDDVAGSLSLADNGIMYVTGTSSGAGWSVSSTIKYRQTLLSVQEPNDRLPKEFSLEQNYPNPFNPSTTMRFTIPHVSHVTIQVFDILGRNVRTIVDHVMEAGRYSILWDGTNDRHIAVTSGIYFAHMRTANDKQSTSPNFTATKKMLLLR